jgi:hypothetical protein
MNMESEHCSRCGAWLKGNGVTVPYHCPNSVVPQDAAPDDRPFVCDLDEEEVADLHRAEAYAATWAEIFSDERS